METAVEIMAGLLKDLGLEPGTTGVVTVLTAFIATFIRAYELKKLRRDGRLKDR